MRVGRIPVLVLAASALGFGVWYLAVGRGPEHVEPALHAPLPVGTYRAANLGTSLALQVLPDGTFHLRVQDTGTAEYHPPERDYQGTLEPVGRAWRLRYGRTQKTPRDDWFAEGDTFEVEGDVLRTRRDEPLLYRHPSVPPGPQELSLRRE